MKKFNFMKSLLMLAAVMLMWGCGSGGENSAPAGKTQSKTVSLSAPAKGLEITIILPAGVTIKADADGKPLAGVISFIGENATLVSYFVSLYTPASGSTQGKVKISVLSAPTSTFKPGDFFTLNCDVDAGVPVTPDQFGYEGLKVTDEDGIRVNSPTAEISF